MILGDWGIYIHHHYIFSWILSSIFHPYFSIIAEGPPRRWGFWQAEKGKRYFYLLPFFFMSIPVEPSGLAVCQKSVKAPLTLSRSDKSPWVSLWSPQASSRGSSDSSIPLRQHRILLQELLGTTDNAGGFLPTMKSRPEPMLWAAFLQLAVRYFIR